MSGNREVKSLPFAFDALGSAISEQALRWYHDRIYAKLVERLHAVQRKLESVDRGGSNPHHSDFTDLKRAEHELGNGAALVQLFYDSVGGDGNPAGTAVLQRLRDDFGSQDSWAEDFSACAKATRRWALLCWHTQADVLRNHPINDESAGLWDVVPLLAIDCSERAYYYDHGPKRSAYISAILERINWKQIDKRYVAVTEE